MRRQHCPANAGRKRRNDGMRTDGVSAVNLDNQSWPDSRLLRPDYRVEITQDHIAPDHRHHRMSPRAKPSSYVSKLRKYSEKSASAKSSASRKWVHSSHCV